MDNCSPTTQKMTDEQNLYAIANYNRRELSVLLIRTYEVLTVINQLMDLLILHLKTSKYHNLLCFRSKVLIVSIYPFCNHFIKSKTCKGNSS